MREKLASLLFGKVMRETYKLGFADGTSEGIRLSNYEIAQRLDKHDVKSFAVPEMLLGYEQARKAVEGVL